MLNTPFSPWPVFSVEEQDAVSRCLASGRVNYWTGEEGRLFEQEFATWCGTLHAVALANGTVALELALKTLGIGAGDEVVVTPRSFIASASSVVLAGATPVFADVDLDSQNITAETVARVLSPRTRAIICVHLAGWPCEMQPIIELAKAHGVAVIEDCAQAHGGRYRGRPLGSLGDLAAWSFCQDKIMSTGGEGGMLTLNDRTRWTAAWSYKDHGKDWDAVHGAQRSTGFRWLHTSFGTNWRITEMQAAIGRVQLRRMPEWHAIRARHAAILTEAAVRCAALRPPLPQAHVEHAWYKWYAMVRPEGIKTGWSRDRIIQAITERGVPCYSGSCPEIYLEKAFSGQRPIDRLPQAQQLGETSLMLLVHPTLTADEMSKAATVLSDVMRQATR